LSVRGEGSWSDGSRSQQLDHLYLCRLDWIDAVLPAQRLGDANDADIERADLQPDPVDTVQLVASEQPILGLGLGDDRVEASA
jgi:hypothetical protein